MLIWAHFKAYTTRNADILLACIYLVYLQWYVPLKVATFCHGSLCSLLRDAGFLGTDQRYLNVDVLQVLVYTIFHKQLYHQKGQFLGFHLMYALLYIVLIIHFGMTAFLLAEPSLIATGAYFGQTYSSVSSGNNRLDNMFRTSYILIYVILFFLLILYAFFRKFIGGILRACCGKCQVKETSYKSTMIQKMNLFSILSKKQRW